MRTRIPSRSKRARARLLEATSLVLLAGVIASSCSDSGSGETRAPCETVLKEQCGAPCSAATQGDDCDAGLHCGPDDTCTADCVAGEIECSGGAVCTEDGRCLETPAGLDGQWEPDGGDGSAASFGDACTDIDVPFDEVVPSVVLLVDQSGSMDQAFGGGTRWEVLHDALMNTNDGVVWTLQAQVRFGLTLYTSQGGNQGGTCPILTEVGLALNNHSAIEDVYGSAAPERDTPTAESIEAVTDTLSGFGEPGPKLILLVTDGLPDNCDDADAHDATSQAMSVAATEAANQAGIELIPMGLSAKITREKPI